MSISDREITGFQIEQGLHMAYMADESFDRMRRVDAEAERFRIGKEVEKALNVWLKGDKKVVEHTSKFIARKELARYHRLRFDEYVREAAKFIGREAVGETVDPRLSGEAYPLIPTTPPEDDPQLLS